MSDDISKANPMNNILVLALVVAAFAIGILYTKVQTLEKVGKEQAIATPAVQAPAAQAQPTVPPTLISTVETKENAVICKENGKPIVYLFSTEWCPHCQWIKDTFDRVAKEYVAAGKIAAHHWELSDMQQQPLNDDLLTDAKETAVPEKDMAVYREFNPGGSIPTFVFGCKYSRTGNGYERYSDGLQAEEKEFRALFDEMAKN